MGFVRSQRRPRRSSYDRPQRLTGNVVYEFPFIGASMGSSGGCSGVGSSIHILRSKAALFSDVEWPGPGRALAGIWVVRPYGRMFILILTSRV